MWEACIKDKNLICPPLSSSDVDISASETCVPPRCRLLSVPRTKIRKKLTGAKGKERRRETDLWRHEWLAGVFFLREREMDRVGDVEPWLLLPPSLRCHYVLWQEEVFAKLGAVRKGDSFTLRVLAARVAVRSRPTYLKVECERKRESFQVVLKENKQCRVKVKESLWR